RHRDDEPEVAGDQQILVTGTALLEACCELGFLLTRQGGMFADIGEVPAELHRLLVLRRAREGRVHHGVHGTRVGRMHRQTRASPARGRRPSARTAAFLEAARFPERVRCITDEYGHAVSPGWRDRSARSARNCRETPETLDMDPRFTGFSEESGCFARARNSQ